MRERCDNIYVITKMIRMYHRIVGLSIDSKKMLAEITKQKNQLLVMKPTSASLCDQMEDMLDKLRAVQKEQRESKNSAIELSTAGVGLMTYLRFEDFTSTSEVIEIVNVAVDSFISNFYKITKDDLKENVTLKLDIEYIKDSIYTLIKSKSRFVQEEEVVNFSTFEEIVQNLFSSSQSKALKPSTIFQSQK